MEQNLSPIRQFLTVFCNTKLSPPVDDTVPLNIASYILEPEEVFGEVSNWVLNHFEQRNCPPELSTAVAKTVATKLSNLASEGVNNKNDENTKSWQDSCILYEKAIKELDYVCSCLLNEPDEIENFVHSYCKRFAVSSFAIRNKRRKMEDRHVVVHDLNAMVDLKDIPPHSYYAVFDGHAGADAASYAASQLHVNLAKHPAFVSNTLNALKEAYEITHERIVQKNLTSGCTAVSALIRERTIFLAWLGDSQALLVKHGKPFTIMNPHKPEREDERKRIEALGGIVTFYGTWRVNGNLSVSRALGDSDHKPFVSHEPDCTVIELDGSEDFLVLACDGLWDEVTSEEVAATLYLYLNDSTIPDPVDSIAAKLVHQSKLQGSGDNITTIVILLRDVESIRKDSAKFLSQFTPVDKKGTFEWMSESREKESGIAKPNVLELNGTATKKASYAEALNLPYNHAQVNDQSSDAYQTADSSFSNSDFFSSCNLGLSVPLEATSLSELPTPPIDDVFATQKFGQLSATDLCEGLDKMTLDVDNINNKSDLQKSLDADSVLTSVDSALDSSKDSLMLEKTDSVPKGGNDLVTDLHNGKHQNYIDSIPDDTLGIASTVVTNAIERAVEHVSLNEIQSPSKPVQCSQKLNPYAEPFVMKSFFVEGESTGINEEVDQTVVDSKLSQSGYFSSNVSTSNPAEEVVQCNNTENDSTDFLTDQRLSDTGLLQADSSISQVDSPEQQTGSFSHNISKDELIQIDHPEEPSNSDAFATEVPQIEAVIRDGVSPDRDLKDNLDTLLQSDLSHSNHREEVVSLDSLSLLAADVTSTEAMETGAGQMHPSLQSLEMNKTSFQEHVLESENKVKQNISNNSSDLLISVALSPEVNQAKATRGNLISDQLTKENLTSEPCTSNDLDEISFSEGKLISFENSLTQAESNDNTPALKNQDTPSNVLGASLVIPNINDDKLAEVENEKKDSKLLKDVEEKLLKTVSKEQAENFEDPLCNVCLQSLPDGIPEAEGVTEDIDSDSEKDGGWSYMKVNAVSSTKSAPEAQSKEETKTDKKVEKSTSSQNIKSSLESKLKIKTVGKSSKVVSSKDLDVKEKIKIKGTSLLSEKAKVSNLKVRKEVALPSTKVAPTKIVRSTVQRNPAVSGRTGTVSTATVSRPKSTVAPTEVKVASCTGSSATLASKTKTSSLGRSAAGRLATSVCAKPASAPAAKPLPQLSKSSFLKPGSTTAEAKPRPLSAVGSKAARETRSMPVSTLPSSGMEAKSKPVTAAVRKTLSTVPKRSDIKETKNTVNKRISAGNVETLASSNKKEVIPPKPNVTVRKPVPSDERLLRSKPAQISSGAEIDKITKRPIKSIGRTITASKPTKEVKGNASKSAKIVVDKIAKNKDSVEASTIPSPANASEQEKFLLEANVKEVFSNELKTEVKNELCTDSQNQEAVTPVNIETSASEIKSETEIALPNAM